MQNKKRHYKVVYIATGYMGNKYDAGIFEFDVSDRGIKKADLDDPKQYGFFKNYKLLARHFPSKGGFHTYVAAYINK